MAQEESARSRKIMTAIRARGWFCFKVHGNEKMMAGLPDIIVCAEGLFIGLETKNPSTKEDRGASARQVYVHSLIRDAAGVAEVVASPNEAIRVIQKALEEYGA